MNRTKKAAPPTVKPTRAKTKKAASSRNHRPAKQPQLMSRGETEALIAEAKRKAKKGLSQLTADELVLLAWDHTWRNRHKRVA